ncbi:MAG: ABC transporter substrate-binding protein [Nannocystis sp.]|nr:ABC transporter substrate-binding protein [Nannocystis sp.]MBA3548417.1 ABC transporter substrate-binding protein [Nannocystis sp.]
MSRATALRTCLPVFGLFAVVAATAAVTVACSVVSKVDYDECTASSECRSAFGLGWVCGDAGLCEEVALDPRCKTVFPKDLVKAPEKYPDAIIFGSLFDHNKTNGDLILVNAANLAIAQANSTGLTDGRVFGMVHCDYQEDLDIDDKTSDVAAVDGAKFLVDQMGVSVIVGPGTSGLAEAVFKELQKPEHAPQALVISPSATSPSLTDIDVRDGDKPGLFWRSAPSDAVLSQVLAERMVAKGITTAYVIYADDSYSSGLANALDKNFEPTLERFGFSDATGPVPALTAVSMKPSGPGVAVVFIGADVAQVVDFLNVAGDKPFYNDVDIFLGDAAYNVDVIVQTKKNAATLYPRINGVFPGSPSGTVYENFLDNYKVAYPGENPTDASYSPYTYDAAWLAIYGAAWAEYQQEGFTGLDHAFGLQQVSDPLGVAVDLSRDTWNTVKREFKAGRGININGASGELDYDPETEETSATVIFWKINDTQTGFENVP